MRRNREARYGLDIRASHQKQNGASPVVVLAVDTNKGAYAIGSSVLSSTGDPLPVSIMTCVMSCIACRSLVLQHERMQPPNSRTQGLQPNWGLIT